ncbi:hypothetical protein BJ742DRAFT_805451 [Cladochytrium replicatum]|nr:hypothetical protein BJ742DRAFT_805451 [Cladochytrium replicatum]
MAGCIKVPGVGIIACVILLINLWTAITCGFRLKLFFWKLRKAPPRHVRFLMAVASLIISFVSAGLYIKDFLRCANLSAEIERTTDLSVLLWTPQQLVVGMGTFILLSTVASIYSFISTYNDFISKEVPVQDDPNACTPFMIHFADGRRHRSRTIEFAAWCLFTVCATLAPCGYFAVLIALRKLARFQIDPLQWVGLGFTCIVALFFVFDYPRTTWRRRFTYKGDGVQHDQLPEHARWKFRFFILGHTLCYSFFMAPLLWFAIDSQDMFGVVDISVRLFSGLKAFACVLDLMIIV